MAKEIKLTRGAVAIVDDADYDKLTQYSWCVNNYGYAVRNAWVKGKTKAILMHRFILGDACKGLDVDHINRNPLDNRRSNLRTATRSQNMANTRSHIDGKLPKGVTYDKRRKLYFARICKDYKITYLGSYKTPDEAARAYDAAAKAIYGNYARLNNL